MGIYTLKKEDISPLLKGLTVYGTGGGGEPEFGQVILNNEFAQGRDCRVIDLQDVEDDAFVCSGGIMGSVKALENVAYSDIVAEWEAEFPLVNAVRTMERLMGKKVDYMIPFETGGLNTPVIMAACNRLGIPMINGDGVGRAAPETQMTCFIGHGVSLYPMPLSDRYGNTVIVEKADSSTYADEVGRFIVCKGGDMGANAHYPMSGAQAKKACVPDTVLDALELGRKIEASQAQGVSACEEVIKHFEAKELFCGTIDKIEGVDKGGFYLTNIHMVGDGCFAGHTAEAVFKNESMALWVDGELKIMFPDRLFMLDPATGLGVPTVTLQQGTALKLVATPCHPRIAEFIQTPIGQQSMGAYRYGYPELKYFAFKK